MTRFLLLNGLAQHAAPLQGWRRKVAATTGAGSDWSEAVGLAGEFGGVRDVFAGFFAAEAGGGEDFGGLSEVEWVEGATDALHGGEVGFGEHFGHAVLFVFADDMFAG